MSRIRKLLAWMLVLTLAVSLMAMPASAASSFGDVKDGDWYHDSVMRWYDAGILNGYEDGTFLPTNNVKRSEFAKIMASVLGLKEEAENIFADVSEEDWYAPYVLACVKAGIINGYQENGKTFFKADNYITRQEAIKMYVTALKLTGGSEGPVKGFPDAGKVGTWAQGYVNTILSYGAMQGRSDGSLAPMDNISRAEVAIILDRLVSVYVSDKGYVTVTTEAESSKAGNLVVVHADCDTEISIQVEGGKIIVGDLAVAPTNGKVPTVIASEQTMEVEEGVKVTVSDSKIEEETEPEETKPTEPGETKPTEPEETKPAEPEETKPTEPGETKPTEPEETKPTEPGETKPTEPEETKPTEPEATEPSEPEATKPTEPEATKPNEPEETKPTEPEATKPTEPEETKPTEPEETKPTEPEETKPTEPEATEPSEPEETKPTEPEETKPTEPEETEPEISQKPGTSTIIGIKENPSDLFDTDYEAYYVNAGRTYLELNADVQNYFIYEPVEEGRYQVTTTDAKAVVSFWGSSFSAGNREPEGGISNNTFYLNVKNIGSDYVIGITGADSCILEIIRVGDPILNDNDFPTTIYGADKYGVDEYGTLIDAIPKAPDTSKLTLTPIDITGATDSVKPVLNSSDGYYHVNSENGPILYMNLITARPYSMDTLLSNQGLVCWFYENDELVKKERYESLMTCYINKCDSSGFYPVTEELKHMIQNSGKHYGWWDENSDNSDVWFDSMLGYPNLNPDLAWMYSCSYGE